MKKHMNSPAAYLRHHKLANKGKKKKTYTGNNIATLKTLYVMKDIESRYKITYRHTGN